MSLVEILNREQDEFDPVVEWSFLNYGKADPTLPAESAEEVPGTPRQSVKAEKRTPVRRSKPSKVTPIGLLTVTERLRPEISGAQACVARTPTRRR